MIDNNRLKDVSAFLDFATTDLAPKLARYVKTLADSGFKHDEALDLAKQTIISILAVPAPQETPK